MSPLGYRTSVTPPFFDNLRIVMLHTRTYSSSCNMLSPYSISNNQCIMRHGNSSRLLVSLSFMTVWFQGSRQHRYATETLHLTACLRKLWKLDYKQWWMDNCLVN